MFIYLFAEKILYPEGEPPRAAQAPRGVRALPHWMDEAHSLRPWNRRIRMYYVLFRQIADENKYPRRHNEDDNESSHHQEIHEHLAETFFGGF